ncbi:hypothetical protein ACIBHX_35715 [Nonomuraea sp. NPDC050536]
MAVGLLAHRGRRGAQLVGARRGRICGRAWRGPIRATGYHMGDWRGDQGD